MCGRLIARMVWWIVVLGGLGLAWAQQVPPIHQEPSVSYLLVIDHSGSMRELMPDGKLTRWQAMQRQAIELIQRVPLGSHIWLAVFNGSVPPGWVAPFNTEQDRQALIDRIQNRYGPPNGGTALYDTLALAFEEAERLSRLKPNQPVYVLAYTDGKDESSKDWTPQKLAERFNQIVDNNRNVWVFYTRIPGDGKPLAEILPGEGGKPVPNAVEGEFRVPLPLNLLRNQFVLRNAVLQPTQRIEIEFLGSEEIWKSLGEDKKVEVQFVSEDSQPIRLRAPPFVLRKGPIGIELQVENPAELNIDQEYRGHIKLAYPELPDYDIRAPDRIDVVFPAGDRIKIFDVRPLEEATFAARQSVLFWVNTERGAKVVWDFGDGKSALGHEVSHTYTASGQYKGTSDQLAVNERIGSMDSVI